MRKPSMLQNVAPQISLQPSTPTPIPVLFQQAMHWHQQGNLSRAEELYLQLIERKQHHFDALHHLGMIAMQKKQVQQALHWLDRAVMQNPTHALAHANRGIVLCQMKQFSEALKSYDQAIRINPNYAQAHCNRGIALRELGHYEEAVHSYTRALTLKSDYAEAYANRGNAYFKMYALEQALSDCSKAIQLKPRVAQYYCNRSSVLYAMQQFAQAMQDVNQAILLQADCASAYWNRANIYLLHGQLDLGWQDYQWRMYLPKFVPTHPGIPTWRGTQSLLGKSILLSAEQGLGDTLQFCRYIPLVAELGAQVYVEAQASLLPLLEQFSDVCQLLKQGDSLPKLDYQCAMLSLPLAFRTDLHSIPSSQAYLASSAEHRQYWREKLGESHLPRIGLVCSGSETHDNDKQRSMPLAQLVQAMPEDWQLISLQNSLRARDLPTVKSGRVQYFAEAIADFRDTAALCDLVDVVVSVDTSVAHLAGAMGKPTYLLLPFTPDWRWLLNRSDSPWYPSISLYRQTQQASWQGALGNLVTDLRAHLSQRDRLQVA